MSSVVIHGEGLGKEYRRGLEWHAGLRGLFFFNRMETAAAERG
jgi:hypothetical protein